MRLLSMCGGRSIEKKQELLKRSMELTSSVLAFVAIMTIAWMQSKSALQSASIQFASSAVMGNSASYSNIIRTAHDSVLDSHTNQQHRYINGTWPTADPLFRHNNNVLFDDDTSFILSLISDDVEIDVTRLRHYTAHWLSRIIGHSVTMSSNDWREPCLILSLLKRRARLTNPEDLPLHSLVGCTYATHCWKYIPTKFIDSAPMTVHNVRSHILEHLRQKYIGRFDWVLLAINDEEFSLNNQVFIVAIPSSKLHDNIAVDEYHIVPPYANGIYICITDSWYYVTGHPYWSVTAGKTKTYDGPNKPVTQRMTRHIERAVESLASKFKL